MTSDVQVNMSGNADKLTQVRRALLGEWTGWNVESLTSIGLSRFFLALLITYLLMSALFESECALNSLWHHALQAGRVAA